MKAFILDASVTLAWCFSDQSSDYTNSVLEYLEEAEAWVPELWCYEVSNVLLGAERKKKISSSDSSHFIRLLSKLPIKIIDEKRDQLDEKILQLARKNSLSAYDAVYLDLALSNHIPIASKDDALLKACKQNGIKILK